MSLYNIVHGTNPIAPLLLHALGNPNVPRFRDCYLDEDRIVIYTRTGGGNRDTYEIGGDYQEEYNPDGPFNDDLRNLPGYQGDEDDDFDSTYASFYFAIPEDFRDMIKTLREIGAGCEEKPADAWRRVLSDLEAKRDTPATVRAVEAMRPILDQIGEALSAPTP